MLLHKEAYFLIFTKVKPRVLLGLITSKGNLRLKREAGEVGVVLGETLIVCLLYCVFPSFAVTMFWLVTCTCKEMILLYASHTVL